MFLTRTGAAAGDIRRATVAELAGTAPGAAAGGPVARAVRPAGVAPPPGCDRVAAGAGADAVCAGNAESV